VDSSPLFGALYSSFCFNLGEVFTITYVGVVLYIGHASRACGWSYTTYVKVIGGWKTLAQVFVVSSLCTCIRKSLNNK
jgi:hypothetical protein